MKSNKKLQESLPLIIALGLVFLGVFGYFLSTSLGNTGSNSEEFKQALEEGINYFDSGEFAQAKEKFDEAKLLNNRNRKLNRYYKECQDSIKTGTVAYAKIAKSAKKSRNLNKAREAYQAILAKYDPQNEEAKLALESLSQDRYNELVDEAIEFGKNGNTSRAITKLKEASGYNFSTDRHSRLIAQLDESSEESTRVQGIEKAIDARSYQKAKDLLAKLKAQSGNDIRIPSLETKLKEAIEQTYEKYIKDGDDCLARDNCSCAKRNYQKALKLKPKSSTVSRKIRKAESACKPRGKVLRNVNVRRSSADKNIYIKEVELTEDFLRVRMAFRTRSSSGKVYPPGHREAFRIEYKIGSQKRVARLRRVRGLGSNKLGTPFTSPVSYFDLVFDAVPLSTKEINLLEGSGLVEGETYWHFIGIKL